jgi:hypothetical protein
LALALFLFPAEAIRGEGASPSACRSCLATTAPFRAPPGPQIGAPAQVSPGVVGVDTSNPIYWVMNSKTRMIQVATIGMAVGLFIMMRK